MKKLIHVLNINDFFPELFALTFPTIKAYAERHGFLINLITERKFPDYPINYEKMQVFQDGMGADLNMLCDADMLIHPHFPDVHEIVKILLMLHSMIIIILALSIKQIEYHIL